MADWFGKEVPKLGFGMMRLPKRGVVTDIEQTKKMVDLFMQAGFTYFDTAFVYPGSEAATKKALVDRYPRESYTICTKINAMLPTATEKSVKKQFETSLQRTGSSSVYCRTSGSSMFFRNTSPSRMFSYTRALER